MKLISYFIMEKLTFPKCQDVWGCFGLSAVALAKGYETPV